MNVGESSWSSLVTSTVSAGGRRCEWLGLGGPIHGSAAAENGGLGSSRACRGSATALGTAAAMRGVVGKLIGLLVELLSAIGW